MRPDPARIAKAHIRKQRLGASSKVAAELEVRFKGQRWLVSVHALHDVNIEGPGVDEYGSLSRRGELEDFFEVPSDVQQAIEDAIKKNSRRLRLMMKHGSPKTASMSRTAGEVRFIKDRGGDKNEWGWGSPGPSERQITSDFVFDPKYLKPLATTMRSALMALGHVSSAQDRFLKIKSRDVSPDGSLGGKGYIQKVSEMRRQLMNCSEALSAFTDTIYDEMAAPHWDPAEDTLDPRDRDEVREIVEEAEEIREDPTGWADEEEEDEFGKTAGRKKTAAWAGIDYMRGDDRWTLGKAVEKRRVRVPSGYELVSEPGKVVVFNWGVLEDGATAEFRFMPDGTNIQFIVDGYNDKRSPGLIRHKWTGNPVDDAVLIEKHVKKYMPALVKAVSDDEEDLLREIERRQRMAGSAGSADRVLARFMEVKGE